MPVRVALGFLHRRDVLAAGAADVAQRVEVGVDAVADHAAVAGQRRRLLDQRRGQRVAHVGEVVQLADQALDERRRHRLEHQPHARDRGQRLAQRDQVARAGRADRHPADEPLEIVDGAQRIAQAAALGRLEGELLDGVEPILDPLERGQRAHQPGPQAARAHHRLGAIDHRQQRTFASAVGALEDLEVAERHRIDQQAVLPLAPADGADVGEVDLLGVAQVLDEAQIPRGTLMSTTGRTSTDGARDRRILRDQRGVRSGVATAASNGERIPLPPRERRPALAALAVLLIVGGAAIAGLLALRADDRDSVVVLREAVVAGQPLTAEQLTTALVSLEGLPTIPESEQAQVEGTFAATALPAGTVLTQDMLTPSGLLQDGRAAVGLALRAGLLPANGLVGGDVVDVVSVPTSGAPLAEGAESNPVLVADARVSSARVDDSSGPRS